MTIWQWAVCGFLFWNMVLLIGMATKQSSFIFTKSVIGGAIFGIVAAALGYVWNL